MADPNAPSWLSENAGDVPVRQDAIQAVPEAAAPAGGGGEIASAADEKDLPHVILMMRLANMGAAVALITCSVRREWNGME
jgi:hypothetical protein